MFSNVKKFANFLNGWQILKFEIKKNSQKYDFSLSKNSVEENIKTNLGYSKSDGKVENHTVLGSNSAQKTSNTNTFYETLGRKLTNKGSSKVLVGIIKRLVL